MDPDTSGRVSDPGVFNAVVSNEPVEVKLLYKDTHPQRLGVVVWRFFNDSPGASGGGVEGMGRRIITIPFDVEPSQRDPLLKQKIVAEAAGIFAWAYGMTTDDMTAALANSGTIQSSAAASIEHALERDPVVRFLLETYPEGVDRIKARDLFKQWCSWCADERHETGSNTRFGGLVKKVLVGEGSSAQGVHTLRLKTGKAYTISPMKDFPLSQYFGVAQLNPTSQDNPAPNSSPSNDSQEQPFDQGVHRVHSSLLKKRDKEKNIYLRPNTPKETLCPPEPVTPCTHPADAFTDASWAVSSESFVEAQEPIAVYFSGTDGAHLIGEIHGPNRQRDLMVVQTPSGKIIGCTRTDYTLEERRN